MMRLVFLSTVALRASAGSWSVGGRTDPSTRFEFLVNVRSDASRLSALESTFWQVSDPVSPRFGVHLTSEEANAYTAPSRAALDAVIAWLSACGSRVEVLPVGDWVRAEVSVKCAESLVGAEYYAHTSTEGERIDRIRRSTPLKLPASVRDHVMLVEPTTSLPPVSPIRPKRRPVAARGDKLYGTNPTTIRTAYGIGAIQANNSGSADGPNTQQVAGFLKQFADPKGDLQSFFGEYYKAGKGREFAVVGPNTALDAGDEASLDTQYIMAIGSNVSTVFWSTPGERPFQNEPYLVWLLNVTSLSDSKLPNVLSVSYGDNEFQIDPAYAASVDVLFQKLGARGSSMIFASGDGGVSGGQAGPCLSGDRFVPTWPAGDPFVTSVGATQTSFVKASTFSSGGFSNFYAAPSFTQKAIAAYKATATGLPAASHYNATGRGFPDVSTVGESFWIFCQGLDEPVDGTSCAAPTFSGVISLLNDARVGAGKKSLGCVFFGRVRIQALHARHSHTDPRPSLAQIFESDFLRTPGNFHRHHRRLQPWLRH